MLTAIYLTLLTATEAPSVADYFPLKPGTKWVYREELPYMVVTYVDEVGEPIEIAGEKATPIVTTRDERHSETVYYRITGNVVYIVAYDPKKPLDPPRPILKAGERKETWEYVGLTPVYTDPVPLKVKAECVSKGRRRVLERDVECLEVKFDAQLGRTTLDRVDSKQTALYAKGIGLVEMVSHTTIDKKTDIGKLRLVEYKPASP